MPYVRTRGNQLAIVHGEREPGSGKVQQRILFTVYSQAEAREILGRGSSDGRFRFQALLHEQFPELEFSWEKIDADIEKNLAALPKQYDYDGAQLEHRFRKDLCAFTRQLIHANPQELISAAHVIQQHRHELEYLADLIEKRLELSDRKPTEWNADNPFYWRFALQGRDVPPDIEERAKGCYERKEYEKAEAIFRLLVECYGEYAEGYNHLGVIAYRQHKLDQAICDFQKAVELGRKLFPPRIPKKHFRFDSRTGPYMSGLRNLTKTLNEAARFQEALALCDRLAEEGGDENAAAHYRANIFLNTGKWQSAAQAAHEAGGGTTTSKEGFLEAFALFELGQTEGVLAIFLSAALRFPLAARMLLGLPTPEPKSSEAEDYKTGAEMLLSLHAYLKTQPRRSRAFFKSVAHDVRVFRLLDESITTTRRWRETRGSDRTVVDRMQLIHSREFARSEANKLSDLLP